MEMFNEPEPAAVEDNEQGPIPGGYSINIEAIMTSSDAQHDIVRKDLGLAKGCPCNREDCGSPAQPTYSRLRVAVLAAQMLEKQYGHADATDELREELAQLDSKELAAILVYAIARSNLFEREFVQHADDNNND